MSWQRWVFSVGMVAASLVTSAAADRAPRGLSLCAPDGLDAWVWVVDDDQVHVSPPEERTYQGAVAVGAPDDCVDTAACLATAGLAWKEWVAIVGTVEGETLTGTGRRDVIVGLGGHDRIDARGGQDVVCAGSGDDDVTGGAKGDVLIGGNGSDVLRGGPGRDVVRGNNGDDILLGGGWHDTLRGGPDHDALYGGSGFDDLEGGAGSDACFGGGDIDTIARCPIANEAGVRYGAGTMRRFTVQIEDGLGLDVARVEAIIDRILGDERSWVGGGAVGFRRVRRNWDFRIYIATPATVDAICHPLDTGGYLSCRNGSTIALNVDRWLGATAWWPATLEVYRHYLVNHETGHVLGRGHVECPGSGELAPVMMQQTKGLDGCIANGWVYP